MQEMVGGCCVCSDDRGWPENPLVYCDGPSCTVAVHQACYGIVTVPTGNWYCRKCEVQDRTVKMCCELCPNKDGALKPTDNNAWAHVVCALYIPEVRFGNVTTMEPIILSQIPQERYNKTCYICEESSRGSGRSSVGACMQCNKAGCKQQFHVTCAQGHGLLCEEAGNYLDNVKYCGYCHHHYTKLRKGGNVKIIPPYRPIGTDSPESSPVKEIEPIKTTSRRKLSTGSAKGNKTNQLDEVINNGDDVMPPVATRDSPQLPPLPHLNAQDQKIPPPAGGKRKKGGSRTPPTTAATGVSPDASPRPITPQSGSNSLSGLSNTGSSQPPSSMNPVVSIGSLTGVSLPLPPSLSTPSTQSSSLPGQVSAAAIVASTASSGATGTSGNPTPVVVEPKRQIQGVLKEARPNSIVVNVPLEVALPSSTPSLGGNTPVPSSSPSLLVTDPISPPAPPPTQMEVTSLSQQPLMPLQQLQQQAPPVKRVRSQSLEKSENNKSLSSSSRRSSKRGTSSSSLSSSSASVLINANSTKSSSPSSSSTISQPSVKSELIPISTHHSSSLNILQQAQNHLSLSQSSSMVNHHGGSILGDIKPRKHSSSHSSSISSNHLNSSMTNAIKEEKDVKLLASNVPHMLGNQLNPSSTMAQKMCDTLSQEMVAHSVFNSGEILIPHQLVGPQPPRSNSATTNCGTNSGTGLSANNHGSSWTNTAIPQSLEQLLERQWEQGSQFLMEQAQHFDIASLISCLHQLRAENTQLEEHVTGLLQRRDHLLAVNARLAIPLIAPITTASTNTTANTTNSVNPIGSQAGAQQPAIVENGLPSTSPHPQEFRQNIGRQQGNGQNAVNSNSQFQCSAQNSVLVRTNSAEPSRRSSQSPAGVYSTNSSHFQSSNQSAQLQSQVVMRRGDVIAELSQHHSQPTSVQQQQSSGSQGQRGQPSTSS